MGARVEVVSAQDLWINVPSREHVESDGVVIIGHSAIPH
jgi:hypothetical protein